MRDMKDQINATQVIVTKDEKALRFNFIGAYKEAGSVHIIAKPSPFTIRRTQISRLQRLQRMCPWLEMHITETGATTYPFPDNILKYISEKTRTVAKNLGYDEHVLAIDDDTYLFLKLHQKSSDLDVTTGYVFYAFDEDYEKEVDVGNADFRTRRQLKVFPLIGSDGFVICIIDVTLRMVAFTIDKKGHICNISNDRHKMMLFFSLNRVFPNLNLLGTAKGEQLSLSVPQQVVDEYAQWLDKFGTLMVILSSPVTDNIAHRQLYYAVPLPDILSQA